LPQYGYALQQIVVVFVELLTQLEQANLTHTYHEVFQFCEHKSIDYLVLRYLNTGIPPFEEWAEEWLQEGEIQFSHLLATDLGCDSISVALGQVIQEVESWDKTREKSK
jgi:hypothetical protein